MILCAGEALIDMLPRDVAGDTWLAPVPGGAVFNTAVALGRLGAPVAFFSGISTDPMGARLVAALEDAGVDPEHLARSDRPTTLAFVTLTDGQARYHFYDENTAGRMLTRADLPGVTPQAAFFGGISLMSEPCGDAYEALARRYAGQVPVMVDPNIRPDFVQDADAYRQRLRVMCACADIIKTSDEDLDWIAPGVDAAGFREETAAAVLVETLGAEGVRVHADCGVIEVPARRVEVVDTVGAGDTFNAGFLAGLHRAGALTLDGIDMAEEVTLRAAAELGVAAAAVTVSRAGANPPWARELA